MKWLKYDTSPLNIYFLEHFNSISGKSYNILCFITDFSIKTLISNLGKSGGL